MRGKLRGGANVGNFRGLIPAHAGKTIEGEANFFDHSAHPRACGENVQFLNDKLMPAGSSPRMRGKRGPVYAAQAGTRLIPAHAGKTF